MRNGDQSLCPLTQCPPPESGDAEFRDDIVYIVLAGAYLCTWRQERHDSTDFAALGGRGECDKALSALGPHRSLGIVRLSAGARIVAVSERLCAHLPIEAHQKGGAKAARDIDELVGEVTGLFAGGQLSEDALEGAMRALNDAYWMAKEKNKKFTPKKYRQQEE